MKFVLGVLLLVLSEGLPSDKRVSVSEVTFDSAVSDIQWCGKDHKTVLVKTAKGRFYRSTDSGRTWTEVTDTLQLYSGSEPSSVEVDSFTVNPADRDVVMVVGVGRLHFISTDAARTFRRLQHDSSIHSWMFHPNKPGWALLSLWTDACTKTPDDPHQKCNHMLHVTKNYGKSFQTVVSYVVQFSWGDPKTDKTDRVYFTHHRTKTGDQPRFGGWSKSVDFSYTDDFGETTNRLVHRGNKFLVSNGFLFVAKVEDPERQTVTLYVSTNSGDSFEKAKLPIELAEKSYTVLDTSEGAIILHVNHGDDMKVNSGNVYISDAAGLRYSLSLPGNVRTASGECEFDKVQSLDGVYLANFKDDIQETSTNYTSGDEEVAETELDRKKRVHSRRSEAPVKTVISFDKGGAWRYLKAPTVDSRGNKILCTSSNQACSLHLHGITNFNHYAPFYSIENAVGIIMGTGNVGAHLRYEQDEVNTYLSRDGGNSWVEAHKGAYIFEFGDHGGLIVMADDVKKTNQVVFSWNEGQSWYDFEVGELPLQVDNVVIEPNSSSVEFLLYGTRGDSGVAAHLDFGALSQPQCKGVWAADSVSSDYETWSPSDGRSEGDRCILGRQVTYTRRKQTSECFNGKDFARPIVKKNCLCTKEDYECEVGFSRKVGSLECRPEDPMMSDPGCTSSQYFYATAYRKVPSDSCIDGWVPEKVAVPCPPHAPFSRSAKAVLWMVVVIIFCLGAVTYISSSPRLSGMLSQYGFDPMSHVKYSMLGGKHDKDGFVSTFDFQPELGFIDGEQDDSEDAPALMSGSPESSSRLESGGMFELEASDGANLSRRAAADVPRLAPPPSSRKRVLGDDLELMRP